MTTYTLTQAQLDRTIAAIDPSDGGHELIAGFLRSLKPNSQEPVGFVHPIEWKDKQSEKVVKVTRTEQPQYGYTNALYTHPAPMSKEDMVKVLELLKHYRCVIIKKDADEAITIMQSAIEGMK
jgi:hypothetical protein